MFIDRESLAAAIQQVQSTVSSEEPSSEEAHSDTQGSNSSLAVPGGGPKRAETFSGFDSKLKPDNKDNINRASSMRTERPGMGFPSRQLPGAVSPVAGASPKIKHKRRSSGGGGWSFLSKSTSKEDKEQTGSTGTSIWGIHAIRHTCATGKGGWEIFFTFTKEADVAKQKIKPSDTQSC